MAKNNNLNDFLKDLADGIRDKKGTTALINAQNFRSEIASIETGITPTGSIDITSNGTVDVTNYASANVNVANQNPYTATNATEMAQYLASKYYGAVVKYTGTTGTYTQNRLYKVIQVTSNEYTFEELITPVGSTTKTENGTYDVKEYAEVIINVPTGITPTGNINITDTNITDVTNYATAQVVDSNLTAENIKKDINILGITGTLESGGTTSGSTLKGLLDLTKSTEYLFKGYSGTTIPDGIIEYSDTSNVNNMKSMFSNCSKLTTIPLLDTNKVTTMQSMFYNCSSLTTIPQLDTSKVLQMQNMFYGCSRLTTIPLLDTSNVTSMYYMFINCNNLTTIPLLNTIKVVNMQNMFNSCQNLTEIPQLDVINVTNMDYMFNGCNKLKSILMTNIGANLDISVSTQFERTDLVTILNNLKTVTSTKTLTMGATNLAKLTDEDKAIATNKG